VTAIEAARVAFAGTPEFAVPSLRALIDAGAGVASVHTQPDRPAGRGRRLTASPVKQLAASRGIAVLQPARLDAAACAELPEPRPDLLVVVAYGLLLPPWMLDWPRIAAVNVHASLLPRWRGAAPIQQAILAGDRETGVSLMRVAASLDTGPVYARRATAVDPGETAGALHDRLAGLGAGLLRAALPGILDGTLVPEPQREAEACYAPKIDKGDAILDWREPARALARRVRAFNPWPVAEARTPDGGRLRVWQAEPLGAPAGGAPGTIVATGADGIDVATGDGRLRLLTVQSPGGRRMSAAAWLTAHSLDGVVLVGPG
jgi:methionyl-tRNA formyltransferase